MPQGWIFVLGLVFLWITGCAGIDPDFKKAQQENTEQAYLAFIQKYRDQPDALEQVRGARLGIIHLKLQQAQEQNSVEGFDAFVDLYNQDPLAADQLAEAEKSIESLIFEKCRLSKDPKDLRKYIARYSERPIVPENFASVMNWLRYHDLNLAKKQDSLITYSTFLSNYMKQEYAKQDVAWVRK